MLSVYNQKKSYRDMAVESARRMLMDTYKINKVCVDGLKDLNETYVEKYFVDVVEALVVETLYWELT